MTTGKEWKIILLFSLPLMAGNLLQQLYSIVGGIIVGNFINERAFASVITCQPLTTLFLSVALGLSVGASIVISQNYGADRKDRLPVAVDTALILLGICGIVFSVLGIVLSPVLLKNLLGVPEDLLPNSIAYMRVYCVGLIFQFLYNGIAAALRSVGDSKATLYFLLIATLLSTVLTFLFILVIPWGVAGSALATVLAQLACVIVSYIYLRKRFPYSKTEKHWDKEIAGTMAKLGLPIALQMGIISIGHGAMNRLVNSLEPTAPGIISAYGASSRIEMFIFVPISGFQSGLASFVGQNIGAGKLDRANRGFGLATAMATAATIVLSIIAAIFAGPIVTIFGLSGNALQLGMEKLRFLAFFYWMFASYNTLGGLLQGAGDTLIQSAASLFALSMQVATGYLFVYLGLFGYAAVWVAQPFGWGGALSVTLIRYITGGWKKKAIVGKISQGGD